MKKKILTMFLSMALVLTMMPAMAMTAYGAGEGTTSAPRTEPLDLTTMATTDNLATEGWKWEVTESSKTLTLSGAAIVCPTNKATTSYAINLPDGATIVLADNTTNVVEAGYGVDSSFFGGYPASLGIRTMGKVYISGNGTLNVRSWDIVTDDEPNVQSTAIFAMGGVHIGTGEDYPKIDAYAGNTTNNKIDAYSKSYGCFGSINISSGAIYSTCGTVVGTNKEAYAFYTLDESITAPTATTISGSAIAQQTKDLTGLTAARIDGGKVKIGETTGATEAQTAYIDCPKSGSGGDNPPVSTAKFDNRFGGTNLTSASYTVGQSCPVGGGTYTFAG